MQTTLFQRILALIIQSVALSVAQIEAALEAALNGSTLLNSIVQKLEAKFGDHPDLEDVATSVVDFAQQYRVGSAQSLTPDERQKLSALFNKIYTNPDPEVEQLIEQLFESVLARLEELEALNAQLSALLPAPAPDEDPIDPEDPQPAPDENQQPTEDLADTPAIAPSDEDL